MRRLLARISTVSMLAVGAVGVGVPASAAPVPIPDPYKFTSADVGFIDHIHEASDEGEASRLKAIDEYVGDKKPIIRLDLNWDLIQPTRDGAPNWTYLDRTINAAYQQGIRVLLILDYAPSWTNGGRNKEHFPTDDDAWIGIVRQVVAHFGPKVQAYEVWNEPNLKSGGQYGDNSIDVRARRYWELTKLAYQEVKAGCAQCVVVAGGSTGGDPHKAADGLYHGGNEASDWLEWAYQHGMGEYFDAVAHHPYADFDAARLPSYADEPCKANRHWYWFGPDDPRCGGLAALREVMVRHGDEDKQIWGTEMGFPSDGGRVSRTPEVARDALEEGIRMWRSRPNTGPLFIYNFQDPPAEACGRDLHAMICNFGLRDRNGKPKEPIYSDVRDALIGENWLPTLAPGRSLFRGAAMKSANGQFDLHMQADGNLVLHDLRGAEPTPIWWRGDRRGYRLTHQHDGNAVLYDHLNRPLWASGTDGRGVSTMRLQDDGALTLTPLNQGGPTWNLFAGPGENWSVSPGATANRHVRGAQADAGTDPYEGTMYTSVSASQELGSIYQDLNRAVNPGDTLCAGARVVTRGEATNGGGTFAVFLTGGTVEVSNKSIGNLPNGNKWTPVSTCVTATRSHSGVRVQFYPAAGGPAIGVDAVDMHVNLARNGGFNNGPTNWTVAPGAQYTTYGRGVTGNDPYEGSGFAATNTVRTGSDGIYQDINRTVRAGDTYCANAQVATQGTETGASGGFVLWLVGGAQENTFTGYANLPGANNWTPISACITATSDHDRIRIQFYPDPNNKTTVIDAVDVHQSIARNGGFNDGVSNWTAGRGTQYGTYGGGVTGNDPYEGSGFAAVNTRVAGGDGIYQDINLAVKAGDTYCANAQVATQGTETGASGEFKIWLAGGAQESSSTGYANLPGGNNWTPISTCVTATSDHNRIRVQFYPDANHRTTVIDAVDVRQSLAVNGGFNVGNQR